MTTYISALTLPDKIFASPAASILTPIVLGSGVGIGISNKKTKETYMSLRQPPLSPPTWVFGPVWTLLYGLMGYAAHRAWMTGTSPLNSTELIRTTRHAATVYSVQLVLNLVWTPLFFGLKKPVAALADITALIGVNVYLTYLWAEVDKVSAYCMVPYLGWLGFATYLCAGVGYVNGWDLRGRKTAKSE
ncbi:TspO/MBR-related protein [Cryphonectria parasitica EP155]|uniref:TspO/MBR-related protein n=1 Tax=Cryphonectria parasitica (strain ATCC 38755 / EP155) TaxID=660469 RepID=A0A9P4YBD9_CRYP1|nr:TspO/MBR-related protein [Cryphonectria parasitica EP155]KAF3769560.1 TspO/MBR-related protein [Cryphonectria parasitica EP155]